MLGCRWLCRQTNTSGLGASLHHPLNVLHLLVHVGPFLTDRVVATARVLKEQLRNVTRDSFETSYPAYRIMAACNKA